MRILGREEANIRVSGNFLKAVVQAFLFLRLDKWVTNPRTRWALGGFQHRVSKQIMGQQLRRRLDNRWEHPPLGGGDTVGGLGGFRDISTEEVEHGQSVHCDMTNSGTIRSVNEEVEVYG